MRIIRVKNVTAGGLTVAGMVLTPGVYVDLTEQQAGQWSTDPDALLYVSNGDIIVNKGADVVDDISDTVQAWNWILGDTLPMSSTVEGKLAVHNSPKPDIAGTETYVVWTGSGDDPSQTDPALSIAGGELLSFNATYDAGGSHVITKDVKFDPRFGRVWLHEAYLKFENGGITDYITADIMAPATPMQTAANLDCVLDGDYVKPAPGGAGTGTHGFAATPTLIPRTFSKDGDWDYDGTNLIPNLTGTGLYKISTVDTSVHRYVNKIPCNGTSSTYFSMTSDETAELRVDLGYFIRISVHNISNTNWNLSVLMEIYREKTVA